MHISTRQQITSTAVSLGVSRQTVSSRLRAVEKALGRQLHMCETDLKVALQLEELGYVPGDP